MNCTHHPFDRDTDQNENIICSNCGEILQSAEQYYNDEDDDIDDHFECCADCDLPDSCADFGCAKKAGFARLDDNTQLDWDGW